MALFLSALALSLILCSTLAAQPAAPPPDVIIFNNGDKLVGHFVRSTASNVTFHSDAIGDLTIDWNKVKELQTNTKVALIRKGVTLRHRSDSASIPQGTLAMRDQTLILTPAPASAPQPVPVADAVVVIDRPAFEKAITHNPSLLQDWKGTATLGAALVAATQNSRTFTGGIALVRTEPTENWLDPRDRTILDFSTSYGEVTQPSSPTLKTSIYHADAERDEYFSRHLFAFAQADFDHNFSQGLNLQQTYSGGMGWTVIEGANQTLDLKGSASYLRQQFTAGPGQSLVGSVFSQHYNRHFKRGFVADEHVTYTPAWNDSRAWSAAFGTVFTMPVYKRLGASSSVIDSFLNDPPPGFKRNSFQFTLGATWSLQ
jgi:hypothetical protein